jgi:predicted metalloprotease
VRRGLSTRILLLVAASLAAAAPTATARAQPGTSAAAWPQAIATWVAPQLNAYWDSVLAKQGLVYENPRYYYWYNRPGYGWLRAPLSCDMYRKRDGLIWGGSSAEYAPNSYFCLANDDFYFDWSFWKTLPRGAAIVVAAHEWGHHVQHLLGWPERERVRRRLYANYELMADCYAGAFMRHARNLGELLPVDVTTGRQVLERLADLERRPWSRARSHGSPADRRKWFARGFAGDPRACARLFGP